MHGALHRLPADTPEDALLALVDQLNADPSVHGILVQLPLPQHIDDQKVVERIDPLKDVDGFHPENAGLLAIGRPRFVPCTPLGVQVMLTSAGIATRGMRAVVLGRSNIVGKPMALLLMQKGPGGDATVTVAHTGSRDVPALCREADLLVAAMGQAEAVRGDWIKPGAVVIDVGIHRKADGKLCGDVNFREAREVASWITPVPGGVGKMTIAMLLRNTLVGGETGGSPRVKSMNTSTERALDRLMRQMSRPALPRKSRFSTAPIVLALALFAGYQITARLVPMVWASMLPGGLDQARFFRGWPGLVFALALACHRNFVTVVGVLSAIGAVGFFVSTFARPLRPLVWLMAAATIGANAGIVYVTLVTAVEATAQQAGRNAFPVPEVRPDAQDGDL